MKRYIVYLITNIKNDKCYIGITSKSIEKRFKQHINNAKNGINPTSILYKAIRKYGAKNFGIDSLQIVNNKKVAFNFEKYYIKHFSLNPKGPYLGTKPPYGYNLTDGGEGSIGIKRTKRERILISIRSSKKVIRSDGKVFTSLTKAAKYVGGCVQNISRVIYGKRPSAYGFKWKFLKEDPRLIRSKNLKLGRSAHK